MSSILHVTRGTPIVSAALSVLHALETTGLCVVEVSARAHRRAEDICREVNARLPDGLTLDGPYVWGPEAFASEPGFELRLRVIDDNSMAEKVAELAPLAPPGWAEDPRTIVADPALVGGSATIAPRFRYAGGSISDSLT
jgi:hypothetical protein